MFDPYHKWLGIPKDQRPPTHYQLLGIAPGESDAEVIEEAAVRQIAHVRTYQIGPHAADCTRLLNEISLAKTTLLNPAKRKAYDDKLAGMRAAQIMTAKPPAAVVSAPSAVPSAFLFETNEEEEEELRPPVPRRNLNIARATKRNAPLWIAVGAGGGIAVLVLIVVAVVLALRSEPIKNEPVAVVKKDDNKKAAQLILKGAEEPEKNNPPVIKPAQVPPMVAPANMPPQANPPANPQQVPIRSPASRSFKTMEGQIGWLSLSPDDSKVAVGWQAATVYDVATGNKLATFSFRPEKRPTFLRTPVAFFPDNQRVLYAYDRDPGAAVGDSVNGAALFHLGQEGVQYAGALAVDPAGKRAMIGYNYRLVYWDLETRKEIKTWQTKDIISEIAFTPDGHRAVTGDIRGVIAVWDLDQLRATAKHSVPSHVKSLAVAPDGNLVAAGFEQGWWIFDMQARKFTTVTTNDASGAVAFIAGGTKVLTGQKDGRIVVWDAAARKPQLAWNGHAAAVTRIAVDAKERIAVSGDASGVICVWSLDGAAAGLAEAPRPINVNAKLNVPKEGLTIKDSVDQQDRVAGFNQPTKSFAVNLKAGQRYQVEMTGPESTRALPFVRDPAGGHLGGGSGNFTRATMSFMAPVDGAYELVAASASGKGGEFTLSIQPIGDAVPVAAPRGLQQIVAGKIQGASRLIFLPDGKSFISGGLRLEHWDLKGSLHRQYANRPSAGRVQVALSPDARWVAWSDLAEAPTVFEVATGRTLPRFPGREGALLDALCFSADGSQLLAALGDNRGQNGNNNLVVWSVENQQIVKEWKAHGRVCSSALTADRKRFLLAYFGGNVELLDTANWQAGPSWNTGAGPFPNAPVFASDGHTLALAPIDRGVQLFDVNRSQSLGELPLKIRTDRLAFCCQGQLLLVSEHHLLSIWDVTQRVPVAAWRLPAPMPITAFAVDSQETFVLAVTLDGSAFTWPLPKTSAELK